MWFYLQYDIGPYALTSTDGILVVNAMPHISKARFSKTDTISEEFLRLNWVLLRISGMELGGALAVSMQQATRK